MLRHAHYPAPPPPPPHYDYDGHAPGPGPGHQQQYFYRAQDHGGGRHKAGKKTFAEKLSTKLDKLSAKHGHGGRDRERGSFNRAYQEVYRDYYGNILPVSQWPPHPPPASLHAASPAPKRTFHNVIRRGRSAPGAGPGPNPGHSLANRTWSGWDGGGAGLGLSSEAGEYHNFAINSNVCMCEDYPDTGTSSRAGKKPRKKCKQCGNHRLVLDHNTAAGVRRSVSEESVNLNTVSVSPGYLDPYDSYVRRRQQKLMSQQKPVFYDEQDEYEDIEFLGRPGLQPHQRAHSTRLSTNPVMHGRHPAPAQVATPARRSSSPAPGHKKSARTQSMIVNNRSLALAGAAATKDNKEMQNIAIRASPQRSASSVTGNGKLRGEAARNVVTVNGCQGATKNSSIIYLSPAQDTNLPSSPSPEMNTTITISTSTPNKLYNSQGSIRVSPYDLNKVIKKYIQDSPNSLSDSNLSSDDQQPDPQPRESDGFSYEDSEDEEAGVHDSSASTRHFLPGPNGFKISGQKIQIYSDGSVTATDTGDANLRAYSLSDSEEESGGEEDSSEDSNYDADCSVLESPRIVVKAPEVVEAPMKPPRRRSAEKDAARIGEDIERLQLQERLVGSGAGEAVTPSLHSSPSSEDMKTFPRSRVSGARHRHHLLAGARRSSPDTHSATSRSRSFNGSRESLNIFGSADSLGISKNFSSDVIREVYGSKTSLLKHLRQDSAQQREERKWRQSEAESLGRRRPRQGLVAELLSKSTDSILASAGDKTTLVGSREGLETGTVRVATARHGTSAENVHRPGPMFQDTTRLRLMTRPSLKDALAAFSPPGPGSTKLGRVGVSQSFREKMTPPMRPRDPPPPPPPLVQLAGDGASGSPASNYSLAKKFFSFNKTEISRINRFLGIGDGDQPSSRVPAPVPDNTIYDIAENDEQLPSGEASVTVVDNSRFYTGSTLDPLARPASSSAVKKNVSLRLRPKSNEFSPISDPVKPPRAKRERSKSFTPRSTPAVKTSLFNRSLSHIPKSGSNSNLSGTKNPLTNVNESSKINVTANEANDDEAKRTFSSSDLVTIFPDEERRSFKDIRKILSSPSISSSSSCSSSTNQIYRPKSQLSNSSSVMNNSIKEEQIVVLPMSAKAKEAFVDHIYEEIQDKDIVDSNSQLNNKHRPLPPLPSEKQPSPSRSSPSRSSPIITEQSSPVKSIFEGASKYDILNYLEDARERGLTDCDLDLEEEDEEEGEEVEPAAVGEEPGTSMAAEIILSGRKHSNRISNISTGSGDSGDTSGSGAENAMSVLKTEKLTSVDIERNDSGLGSETGGGRSRSVSKVVVRKRSELEPSEDLLCLDCDQVLEPNQETSLCEACGTRRVERKEIITEIIETEIKYGRDLRIILEEFYRPMAVAGLLTTEQLANVFLNVEELIQVNAKFTEALKDAIEIALDQGDEDLCTVSIGKLFLEAAPMLGAFKSYCTRQGSASALLASLEREKELLRIFLKVSQMENTILRRMNLSSFLMVPVQRVTRYPLLLSRLVKVTPGGHSDKEALQEAQEKVEAGLDTMNQETSRDTGTTKLWRRISMINTPYRRSEHQIDLLGSTTWGVRKMVLETLGWGKEPREEVSFVLESRLNFTQPMDVNWRSLFSIKMSPISAQLVTLGHNTLAPTLHHLARDTPGGSPRFPRETGCREAALLLLKEKGGRYTVVREPLLLERCVVSWDQEWDDCFELTEFTTKESYIFKGEDPQQTLHWYHCIRFYCNSLGQWRRRRNGLANIMINGMARTEEMGRDFNLIG